MTRDERLQELYAQQERDRAMVEWYNDRIKETRKEIMDMRAPADEEAAEAQTIEVLGHVIRIKDAM